MVSTSNAVSATRQLANINQLLCFFLFCCLSRNGKHLVARGGSSPIAPRNDDALPPPHMLKIGVQNLDFLKVGCMLFCKVGGGGPCTKRPVGPATARCPSRVFPVRKKHDPLTLTGVLPSCWLSESGQLLLLQANAHVKEVLVSCKTS